MPRPIKLRAIEVLIDDATRAYKDSRCAVAACQTLGSVPNFNKF